MAIIIPSAHARIAILGYGVEGEGTLQYLQKHGFTNLTVVDQKEVQVPSGVPCIWGHDAMNALTGFDVIFRTPGIWRRRPEILAAEAAGALVTSQVEYFLSKATCTVIAVTGTKGKSTTTSLLRHILAESGREVFLAGNIGTSVIELLDEISVGSTVVLELSSFQLQDCRVSPRVSIVLGVIPEHQDVHASVEEYVEAKANIAKYQREGDVIICAPDNAYAAQIAEMSPALQRWTWCAYSEVCVLPRGMTLGAFCREGVLWLHYGQEERLMDRKDVPLLGVHMLQNVLPAVLCASLQGVPGGAIREAVKSFPGVPHRMQLLGTALGMEFYNDSAATTPEAAMAGITAHEGTPIAIILGGGQKGVSLKELARTAAGAEHVHHIILAGKDAAVKLAEHLAALSTKATIHHIENYEALPALLEHIQHAGMRVVLSPGCTSFDLFKNYKDRAESFMRVYEILRAKS